MAERGYEVVVVVRRRRLSEHTYLSISSVFQLSFAWVAKVAFHYIGDGRLWVFVGIKRQTPDLDVVHIAWLHSLNRLRLKI
jgi:hypothetical protein